MLRFCKTCRNLQEPTALEGKLAYVCKFCNNTETTDESALVFSHVLKGTEDFSSAITPYTKYDVTLPHYTNIACPNGSCKTHNKSGPMPEVVGINKDAAALKFVYQCVHCDHVWRG